METTMSFDDNYGLVNKEIYSLNSHSNIHEFLNKEGYYGAIKVGKGGMHDVYKVENLEGNIFAAKTPHKGNGLSLFQESLILKDLDSEHIVSFKDYLEGKYLSALVTDFIPESHILGSRVRRVGYTGISETAKIGKQLANSLIDVHKLGYIHGDLKPSNIAYNGDKVTLFDFDSARMIGTRFDKIPFTPAFVAPEVLLGESSITHSDQFMLGATLMKILNLTKSVPYNFSKSPSGSSEETVRNLKEAIDSNNRNIFPEPKNEEENRIVSILKQLTASKPADRYESIEEVENSFSDFVNEFGTESVVA